MSDEQQASLDDLIKQYGGEAAALPASQTVPSVSIDMDTAIARFGGVAVVATAKTRPDLDKLIQQFGGQQFSDLEQETIASAPPSERMGRPAAPPSPAFFDAQHGVIAPPNIDLYAQPRVKNPDGTVSTVRSMSFEEDGHEILVPTVAADGSRILSDQEAIDQYHRTGKHLGVYASPAVATAYAQALHDAYAAGTYDRRPERTPAAAEQPSTLQRYGRNYALTGQETPDAPPDLLTRGARYVAGGARQVVSGAVQASGYYSQPTDDTLRGANDLLEGALKVATPLAVAGAIVDLPGTLITLGTSWAAAKAAGKTAELSGLSPEAQRFAENVAGATAALGLGTRQIQKLTAKAAEVAGATARATAIAAQLAGRPISEAGPGVGNAVRPGVHAPLEVIDSGLPSTVRSAGNSAAAAPESFADVVRDSPAADAVAARVPNLSAEELDGLIRQYGGTAHQATFLARPVGVATVATRDTAETVSGKTIAPPEVNDRVSEPDAVTPPPSASTAPSRTPGAINVTVTVDGRTHEIPARWLAGRQQTLEQQGLRPRDAAHQAIQDWVDQAGAEPTKHEFASTQIQAPPAIATAVQQLGARIPDAELADDGRETDAHITLKFGLHGNDPDAVRTLLADEPPITVRLGTTSIFPNGESNAGDVVKVDVDSPDLHRLNAKIADALPHTDTHPEYKPHLTIAYVKPGEGQKYAGDASLAGQTFTVDRILFSGKNGERVEIPLGGARTDTSTHVNTPATLAARPSLALQIGDDPHVRAVDSLEHAAQLVDSLVDQHEQDTGEGVSSFPKTTVIDTRTGTPVATISYNGRIWDATTGREINRVDNRGYGKPAPIDVATESPAPVAAPRTSTEIEPRVVGGIYRSKQTGAEYTVLSITKHDDGSLNRITVRWLDGPSAGVSTSHFTAWKPDDEILFAAAPGERRVYQGRGATPQQIYGRTDGVPIFGPAQYYALSPKDAEHYAGDRGAAGVTAHTVRLQNPLVIGSNGQWGDVLRAADALELHSTDRHFKKNPTDLPSATHRLQAYIRSLGHDSVVIENTDREKRLRESFGHDQIIVFGEPASNARTSSEVPPATGEPAVGSVWKIPLRRVGKKTQTVDATVRELVTVKGGRRRARVAFHDPSEQRTMETFIDLDKLAEPSSADAIPPLRTSEGNIVESDGNSASASPADAKLTTLAQTLRATRGSDQARHAARAFLNVPLTNLETGIMATVSRAALDKMLSKSAVDKSVSPAAHLVAVGNVDHLFPLATRRLSRPSAQDPNHVEALHHFDVPMPFDGRVVRVKLLVKAFRDPTQGNRVYTLQALEIGTSGSVEEGPDVSGSFRRGDADVTAPPSPPDIPSDRFAEMVRLVKNGVGVQLSVDAEAADPPGRPQHADDSGERAASARRGSESSRRDQESARTREPLPDRRTREAERLQGLVEQAVTDGYRGDTEPLYRELRDRLDLLKELAVDAREDGHNPSTLLREIAKLGGISLDKEDRHGGKIAGYPGEIRWLKEHREPNGTMRGIRGVFRDADGHPFDRILEGLRQDSRFAYLESIDDLIEAIRDAARAEPRVDVLEQFVKSLGYDWWTRIGHPPAEPVAEGDARDSVEPDDGDTSFDVNAFGEEQPRLPEAGTVRDHDVATPEFEAPFSLTGGADTTPQEREADLFARDLAELRRHDDVDEARPFTGSWDRPPRLPKTLRDTDRSATQPTPTATPQQPDLFPATDGAAPDGREDTPTRRYMRRSDEDIRAWAATLLGIDPHADAAHVRTAYRAAVKANHPDANPTAHPSRMADINVAGQWLLRHPTLADVEPRVGAAEDAPKLTVTALRDLYAQVAGVLLMTRRDAPEYPALLARVTALKARIDAVYDWQKRHSNWEELDQPRWMAESGHRWHENGDVVEDASFGPYWDYRLAVDIDALEQSRAFQRLATAIRTVMDDFVAAFPPHIGQAIGVRGFLFTRNAYGVHVDLHRYGGDRTHGVFINPFEPLLKFPTPDQAASLVAHAILHEITHEIVSGEGEQFTYTLGENEAIIGSTRYERGLRTLREAYGQRGLTGRRRLAPELADILRGYAGAFGTGTDTDRSGGGGRNYVRRPADRDGAQDGVSAGARRDQADAAARTVTDDELRELARRHGTSVDAQRARAEAAGYTIVAQDDTHDAALPLQTVPPIARAAETLRAAGKDITATLTAPSVSQAARLSSRHLRKRLGELTHTVAFANHALRDYRNAVERLTLDHDEILRLADILETGKGDLPKFLQPWGVIRTQVFDYLKKQIADLGIEKQWREHYLGHVWDTQFKDGQSAKDRAMRLIGRRPLEGPKSFLKHRTIPTMRQGVARGLEPKTWNLVEIDLFKIEEMSKFILGRQALNDNRSLGTWTFVSALRKPPTGMVQIPDPIGAVWAPPQITVKEAYDALLTEGLESLIHELGIPYGRVAGTMPWIGRTNRETNEITMRVGAPEGALMHELGHALDNTYGLYRIIANAIKTPEFEGDKSALGELRELAKLRHAGGVPTPDFAKYVQKQAEQIANLVHAYLWAPDEAKRVAPRAYDAFESFVMDHEELHPLMELQKMRSVVIAEREATYRLPGPILLGRYYAAPEVARIFKNYLTPGLGAHPVFQVVRVPSNAMVQLKLSFSLFHMLTVSIEGTSMAAGRMMRDILHGKPLAAVKQAAKVLVEPVDAAARGHAIRKQYLTTLDLSSLPWMSPTNLLVSGGGRVEQSREYTNRSMAKFADNLRRANEAYLRGMHGRALSESTQAAIRLLPAMIEAGAWPILQWFVPRVKSAAAVAEIQKDLEHLPGVPTEDTLLAIASKAVNMTDATLGEVIWDNYFLPRALMSAVQLVIMAPGWRGGSAVMLARGLTDPIRKAFPGQREDYRVRVPVSGGASGGGGGSAPPPTDGASADADAEPPPQYTTETVKEPYWSAHTTFLIGQVFVAILVAELYQHYLRHAGHISSIKDVAYPKTGKSLPNGEPERVRFPGYAGIFFDILRRPPRSIVEYLIGGEAPFAAMVPQLWRNETAFGEQITEPGDPWSAQLQDYLTFLKGQMAPIMVSSYGRRAGTPAEKAESVLGISPAPRRITDTPLEEYLHQVLPPAHKSRDQAERATERRNLREAIRTTPPGGERPAVDTSHLSPGMVRQTARQAFRSPLPSLVQQLSITQALHAYELASPEERAEIRAAVSKKLPTGLASTPPAERAALMQAYRKVMQLPVAPRLKAVGATP